MEIKYYDIGLNLFTRSFPKPEKIISDAEEAGIKCILTGSEYEENELVNDFVKTHDVYGTAGIHPHASDDAKESDIDRIREIILKNPRIVAVGETGLDYDHMYARKENQLHYFRKLIDLAEELKKAGVDAEADVYHTDFHAFDMLRPEDEISRQAIAAFDGKFEYALQNYR